MDARAEERFDAGLNLTQTNGRNIGRASMSDEAKDLQVTESSGNVFKDLGLPDADQLLAKAKLASVISDVIRQRRLTQTAAAAVLGTSQSKVSNLMCGKLEGFSLERLTKFLNDLGRDVEIVGIDRQRGMK